MDSMTESAEQGAAASQSDPVADRPADLEAVLLGAVEQARAAIVEFSGENTVGEYLGAGFDDPTAATHRFLADLPGYRGWQWAVVVAAYPGAAHATVSEVVLVPGPTALLAPQLGAVAGAGPTGRPEPRRPARPAVPRPAAGAWLRGQR